MGYSVKAVEDIKVNEGADTINIDGNFLNEASLTLRAIKHPLRKKMIELINENGSMTVTDLFIKLRIEQSVASQHLAVLRKAKWLSTEREGKYIHYSINYERFKQLSEVLTELV